LVVGGWYEDGKPHGGLYWAVTKTFYEVLRERYGFWDSDIYFLVHKDTHNDPRVDAFSTRANIKIAVDNIVSRAQPQDVVVFFFVGHGGADHFAASDTALTRFDLNNWATGIKSEHQLWTFSPCGSGNFPVTCARAGRTVFSSCRADEDNAMPWAEAVRDAFNYASGADADGNGFISFAEAHNFARQRQINHYGGESRLREHSQFCDCGCGNPTTGMLPLGRHGQTAMKEMLGQELGQIQVWRGTASDGQQFTYPRRFTDKAVVVCSAQKDGKPIAVCAINNTDSGFVLGLQDKPGQRVTNAQAAWVAYMPNGHRQLQANCQWIKRSTAKIGFAKSFNRLPVVVCNAQRQGGALLAGATRFDKGSFDVRVTDLTGQPVNGSWLLWIAAEPGIQRPSLQISGGYMANYPRSGIRKIWDPISAGSEVIMASAAWDDSGVRAMARSSSANEVELTTMTPGGQYAAPSWYAHYLSFRVNPPLALAPMPTLRAQPAFQTPDTGETGTRRTIRLPVRRVPRRR
ncbi:MAG: caspase family protein, partial [Armatimonadota bacterium]